MPHRFLGLVLLGLLTTSPAYAGFQWTAANWSATPTASNTHSSGNSVTGGNATVSIGATNSDILSGNLSVTAGDGSLPPTPGANTATAKLTFSRTFVITEDIPGQPVTVTFYRKASGNQGAGGSDSSGTNSLTLTNAPGSLTYSNFSASTSGAPFNLDGTATMSFTGGLYTVSGEFTSTTFRTSGLPGGASQSVQFGVVPEPALLLPLAGLAVLLRRRIKST